MVSELPPWAISALPGSIWALVPFSIVPGHLILFMQPLYFIEYNESHTMPSELMEQMLSHFQLPMCVKGQAEGKAFALPTP